METNDNNTTDEAKDTTSAPYSVEHMGKRIYTGEEYLDLLRTINPALWEMVLDTIADNTRAVENRILAQKHEEMPDAFYFFHSYENGNIVIEGPE